MLRKHHKGQRKDTVMFFLDTLLTSSKLMLKNFVYWTCSPVRVAWNEIGCVLETAELGKSLRFGAEIA